MQKTIINISHKPRIAIFLILFISTLNSIQGQCDQNYIWANWDNFTGTSATGTINLGTQVSVEMTANYPFNSTNDIYNYGAFNSCTETLPPNTTVPSTDWSIGTGGITEMCFSEVVSNPVLLLSSVGRPNVQVTLEFSRPYMAVCDAGGISYLSDTSLAGQEGYAIIVFPGDFDCITIYSSTPENYTNITWGLNPPLFPIDISGNQIGCENTTLTASGGNSYSWSGGLTPNQPTNSFDSSGNYFLTVTDVNGCSVITSVSVTIDSTLCDCAGTPNGTAVIDDCGECLEPNDPNFNNCLDCSGTPNGTAVIDDCGKCLEPNDPNFSQSCIGESDVYIPNAFSPNDDGINDRFQLFKNTEAEARITNYLIFNRWGGLIYEQKNLEFNSTFEWWDGEIKGKKAEVGVYVYFIEIEFQNGKIKQYEGDVTIVK